MQSDPAASNAGFVGLHNPFGLMMILLGGLLVIGFIILGATLIKSKAAAEAEERARLREALARKNQAE